MAQDGVSTCFTGMVANSVTVNMTNRCFGDCRIVFEGSEMILGLNQVDCIGVDLKEKRKQQEIDGKISPLLVNLKEQLDLDRRNQEVMDELQEISDTYSEKMFTKLAEAEN